jgi:hypothetical protein
VTASGKMLKGQVDVTTATSYLRVPRGYVPGLFQISLRDVLIDKLRLDHFFDDDGVAIGPIPKGTPVGLLGNLDLDRKDGLIDEVKHKVKIAEVLLKIKADLKGLPKDATDEDARKALSNVVPDLLELSKCPDFIVNRGHYFGTDYFKEETGLSDTDKRALIAFLKTF